MNNTFLTCVIFVLILFLYIHITSQWKTSDDLEIYETDFETTTQLQDVCAVKQPVVFKFQKDETAVSFFDKFQTPKFEKYDNLDIRVKDRQDYNRPAEKDTAIDYVPLSFRSARRLFTTDTNAKYFSEKNHTFLEESGLDRIAQSIDTYLKPPLSVYTKHDLLFGSPLVTTPLRYHLESHCFIAVTRGKINVKLCPPKYGKIIPSFKDYENYEFWSPLNPWGTQRNGESKHKDILQKTKFLDIEVHTGDILFLPPYWWYSLSLSGDPETTVAIFTYDVAMNIAAQSNHWALYYLQQNNIKTRPVKKILVADETEPSAEPSAETNHPIQTNREIVSNAGTYIVNESTSGLFTEGVTKELT